MPSGTEEDPTWSLKVVNMSGDLITDLSPAPTAGAAEVDTITWTLNAPDECEFHFPKNAFDTNDIFPLGNTDDHHELQVFRNGVLLFWGPIISLNGAGSDGVIKCRAAGVEWYLNRRFIDGPVDNNLLNPDFEDPTDFADWDTVNNSGTLTATIDTTSFETGAQSAQLVNTTPGGDDYLSQIVSMGGNAIGLLVTVSAWFLIDSITAPAFGTRGLYIEGKDSGVFQANNYYVIDTATPQGKWVKGSTTLWIPPSTTWDIEVRLYGPEGTVRWDDCKLVAMDSLTCANHTGLTLTPIDISDVVGRIIPFIQDTAFGKSGVNLTYDVTDTGIKLIKVYQFVDHLQFDQAMREFIERNDGIDYCVQITSTTRTFKQFAHKRGTDRSGDVTLQYDVEDPAGSNCADYRLMYDGAGCITRQVIIGDDNGPDREQGEAVDASAISGLILQDVKQAPQDATVASLQPFADEQIARYAAVPVTLEMDVVPTAELIPVVNPGDLVNARVGDGWATIGPDPYRIMQLRLDGPKNLLTVMLAKDTLD